MREAQTKCVHEGPFYPRCTSTDRGLWRATRRESLIRGVAECPGRHDRGVERERMRAEISHLMAVAIAPLAVVAGASSIEHGTCRASSPFVLDGEPMVQGSSRKCSVPSSLQSRQLV